MLRISVVPLRDAPTMKIASGSVGSRGRDLALEALRSEDRWVGGRYHGRRFSSRSREVHVGRAGQGQLREFGRAFPGRVSGTRGASILLTSAVSQPADAQQTPRPARTNLLARNEVRLFLTSLAILFVELMLIRWIPANVKYIGFFSNFLLMASFLGIGLGILLGRNGFNPRLSPFAFLLAGVVALVYRQQLNVQVDSPDEIFFGLAESSAADQNFLILPLVVCLVVALLATLALPLGPLLKSMPPLKAYAIDIVGSMTGIAAFTILSALGTSPLVWFAIAVALVVALELGRRLSLWTLVNVGALAVVVLARARPHAGQPERDLVALLPHRLVRRSDGPQAPHRRRHPAPGAPPGRPARTSSRSTSRSTTGSRTGQFDEVLIVGAGSGSDVAIALSTGRRPHRRGRDRPAAPADRPRGAPRPAVFDDPRVTPHRQRRPRIPAHHRQEIRPGHLRAARLADAGQPAGRRAARVVPVHRAGVRAASATTSSDDGIFVLYNYYRDDWLVTKLSDDARRHVRPRAAGAARTALPMATLAAGPLVDVAQRRRAAGRHGRPAPRWSAEPQPKPATDDWPFLYLRTPFVAQHYLVALGDRARRRAHRRGARRAR